MDSNWGYPLLQLMIGVVPVAVGIVGLVFFAARRALPRGLAPSASPPARCSS